MGFDRSITGFTSEVVVLIVWHVYAVHGVAVLRGQTKIDNVDLVATLSDTHEEVVRLDISVDEVLVVDGFDKRDELLCQE